MRICKGKQSSLLITGSTYEVCIVVCGHVDSGKSTLNGHLVYQLGRITEQEMRRATKSASPHASHIAFLSHFLAGATDAGKKSFAFAYLMDSGDEERRRGATVDLRSLAVWRL